MGNICNHKASKINLYNVHILCEKISVQLIVGGNQTVSSLIEKFNNEWLYSDVNLLSLWLDEN